MAIARHCRSAEQRGKWSKLRGRPVRAPFVATLVLTVTLACACFAAAMAIVMAAAEPVPIATLGTSQRQDAETALYVLAFFLILPAALVAVPRLADRIARGPNGSAFPSVAALVAATLAVGILAVRLSSVVNAVSRPAGVAGSPVATLA